MFSFVPSVRLQLIFSICSSQHYLCGFTNWSINMIFICFGWLLQVTPGMTPLASMHSTAHTHYLMMKQRILWTCSSVIKERLRTRAQAWSLLHLFELWKPSRKRVSIWRNLWQMPTVPYLLSSVSIPIIHLESILGVIMIIGISPPILICSNYYWYYPAFSQGKITVLKYFKEFLPTTYPFTSFTQYYLISTIRSFDWLNESILTPYWS